MARPISISRGDILAAAESEFSRRGYGDTSLRQLMAAAGVSTTAFYARYPSKEAVLIDLVDAMMKELTRRGVEALAGAPTVADGIDSGVEVLVSVLERHRAVARLALTEGAAIEPVREALGRAFAGLAELLAGHIAKASETGDARADARGWALVGALHIQVARWAVFDQIGEGELTERLLETARSMLLPGGAS